MKIPKSSLTAIVGIMACLATAIPGLAGRMKVGDAMTLQQAIDAAQPGDVVSLPFAFHRGSVVIRNKSNLEIRGVNATVLPDRLYEESIGIHIINSTNITLNGFVVRDFERAVVIENSTSCTVKGMRIGPLWDKGGAVGAFESDGVVLINSHQSDISQNEIFLSGNNGILLTQSSSGNTIRSNHLHDNGHQTDGTAYPGSGIALDGGNQVDNMINGNNVTNNRWGIYLGPDGASSDNQITRNTCTGNRRAGIALFGGAENNMVKSNSAAGNDTLHLDPSTPYDIFDASTGAGNTYDRNKGTFGTGAP